MQENRICFQEVDQVERDSQSRRFRVVDVSKKAVALRGESKIEEYTVLPEFMQTNLKLMRYVKFAPVQRFVIPVATELERTPCVALPPEAGRRWRS